MMFCSECGSEVPRDSAFCPMCGVKSQPEPKIVTLEPVPVQDAMAPTQPEPKIVTLEPIPVQNAAAPPQPETRQPLSVARAIGRTSASVLLGLLLFSLTCALLALLIVRPANLPGIIQNTDFTSILEETGLEETIVEVIKEAPIANINIDAEVIEDFIKRESVSSEIGKLIDKYTQAITEGDMGYYLSQEDIEDFIKAVAPDIDEEFNYKITDDDYKLINEVIQENVQLQEYDVGTLLESTGMDTSIPGILFSVYPIIIVGALCALLILDLLLLHRKRVRHGFMAAGIPVALSGFTFVVGGMLLGTFSPLISGRVFESVSMYAGGVIDLISLYGLICFASGALLIAISIILSAAGRGYAPKPSSTAATTRWRVAGLALNAAILIACIGLSTLLSLNLL